jgi:predicted nuclease with TOPRIM domain
MIQKVFALVVVLVFIAGCAGMSDETRTQAEGTAVGAGLGAALGAGIGYALGGRDGAFIGAGTGAATGGIGGYFYGKHVANRKKEFARQEDYLDALIASAHGVNEKTDALRQEMVQLEAQTAQLVQHYQQKRVQQAQLNDQAKVLTKKVKEGKEQLNALQSEIDIQQKVLAKEQQTQGKSKETTALLKDLQSEITRLESNKAQLETNVQRLASIQLRPVA